MRKKLRNFLKLEGSTISLLDRAPFWGIIGPEKDILPDQILKSLIKFYTEIYNLKSPQDLLNSLKSSTYEPELNFITSEWFIVKAYKYYVREYGSDVSIRSRIMKLKKQYQNQSAINFPNDEQIQEHLNLKGKEKFEAMLRHFFMVDLFPDNIDKISVKYEQVNL